MATSSTGKTPRIKPKSYSICLLYNTNEALSKLDGLVLAGCNPSSGAEKKDDTADSAVTVVSEVQQMTVSDAMSCNFCEATFNHRLEQKRHYRSDWHRYNLKQRLKGREKVTEEHFEEISENISSLSGSDTDSDVDSDSETQNKPLPGKRLPGSTQRLVQCANNSSTDSESDTGNQTEDPARRLPKVYFKNKDGEMLSIYRCVLCHKKTHPGHTEELVAMATKVPHQMTWAVLMAGGGHFAGAVFNKKEVVVHKTFHRYVVRAKRGTAQGSRDSQGNAPKSAGASLRRYNEAMLTQDIQDLLKSWSEHIEKCDRIFLRAPSFNRKVFFSGKNPPFSKDDTRIRLVPFQTRRPTHNEVRRVYETMASIECYGDESHIQDFVPISPPQVFNPETGQLTPKDESQLSPRQRKQLIRKLGTSPLASEIVQELNDANVTSKQETASKTAKNILPDHVLDEDNLSSGTSTGSDTELVETMATIDFGELKEFAVSKKPKKKKKNARKIRNSLKRQPEPESNIMDEEKYHLKNSLYTACKTGNRDDLKNLLAVFFTGLSRLTLCTNKESTVTEAVGASVTRKDSGKIEEFSVPNNGDSGSETVRENEVESEDSKSEIVSVKHCRKVSPQNKSTGDHELGRESLNLVESSTKLDAADSIDTVNDHFKTDTVSGTVVVEKFTEKTVSKGAERDQRIEANRNLTADHNENSRNVNKTEEQNGIHIHLKDFSKELVAKSSIPGNSRPIVVEDMSPVVTIEMLSEPFGDNSTTLLHVGAREGHGAVVSMLMEAGANPAMRDKNGHTPYMVSKDKATRNEFRRFMGKWPDKYDYTAAQIPGPLTEEMEMERKKKEAEKKKAQKKAKQEQQKVQREEEEKQKAEEREKQRFLNLSDREKRALAAEKRLVSQFVSQGSAKPLLSRCFQCGADITGKVPFEYFENKFCTSKCLQQHRKSQTKS